MKEYLYYPANWMVRAAIVMILCIASSFRATASDDHDYSLSLDTQITLTLKNASLKEFIQAIESKTNYRFTFDERDMSYDGRITISATNEPLARLLDRVAGTTPLEFKLVKNNIHIRIRETRPTAPAGPVSAPPAPAAPKTKITGTVNDDKGQGLPGVTVLEKGTTNGTTTDAAGEFALNIQDPQAVLVISYIGYLTQEVPVGTRTTFNVTLVADMKVLEEVVVVGYGVQKRKDLTGSVGSVDNKAIKDLGVTRIDQALAGRVAGVQVKTTTGEPGAAPQIRVRGIGSISAGSGPLYVVDGFPTDNIQSLNPNDIASMDILKDASATAIYGSRGANGVIIINTKRGKVGKPVFTFDTFFGYQKALRVPEYMNARDQAQYYFDGIKNRNMDEGSPVTGDPAKWKVPVPVDVLDVLSGKNTTDHVPLNGVLRTAAQQQYQLGATGGTENVRYAISAEYLKQDGIIINTGFRRYSLRANIDAQLSKKLLLKLNLNPSFTDADVVTATGASGGANEGVIAQATNVQPFYPYFNPDGSYFIFSPGMSAGPTAYNPVALAREVMNKQKKMGLLGNLGAEYSITKDLKFNVMLGASFLNLHGLKFMPKLPVFLDVPAVGTDNTAMTYNWLTEYTLNYLKSFGKHNITGLAGYTVQKERSETNMLTSNSYPNNLVPTLSATSGIITNGTSDVYEWSLVSYLARVNYNYDGKYYLTASIRTDGSSRFGTENKYGVFPSAAVAWRISDEAFLKNARFLSEMKLRASYGETGNNNIGNYEHFATITYLKYALGGTAVSGFAPGKLANPNLTWEKQQSLNVGLDAAFFGNRLTLNIDHFRSRNTDLLLNVNIPGITGFSNSLQNIGEISNTGWEFVASTVNVNKTVRWSTDFNISTYRNRVEKLGPNGDPIYVGASVTRIGQPIGMFYGWLTDGIFLNQAEVDKGPVFAPGTPTRSRPGDTRFVDVSGPDGRPDGIIDNYDRTIMGNPYPDFYYGMTNNVSYKNLTLSISIQGSQGNDVVNMARNGALSTRGRIPALAYLGNYWKSETDIGDGKTVRPNDQPTGNVRGQFSQRHLDNGSYLRVNNITLGYTLPDPVFRRLGLTAARVYLNATNPLIFTKYTNFNPDVSTSENPLTPGTDNNDYPLPKSLILGLNIAF
ncbi:SusC/RagA family TonB-linked outer membrane protein [Larkinella bovis]|uniref:SusC/RagA family TonB-linked outer membrane protein n=1 Tax=Larkinella bovis TaxID=683041 RepID=A0ABW0IEL7_9BACT